MHFNVSQLVRETSGSTREHEVEDRVMFRGDLIEVRGGVRFVRTDKGVWVTALLNTQVWVGVRTVPRSLRPVC